MSRLGVYDSGLGGYTIAEQINARYHNQDIVFLADQKNIPYGNKSVDELEAIVYRNMEWFWRQGVRQVIIACNTTSTLKLERVINDFPDLRLIRIIDLTTAQLAETMPREIIVVATRVTVASHAYRDSIHRLDPDVMVHEVALPELAGLIEALAGETRIMAEISAHLALYKRSGLPMILGCTHYPLAASQLQAYVGGDIYTSIAPVMAQPDCFSVGSGQFIAYTTGDPDNFQRQVKALYGVDIQSRELDIADND